MKAQKISRLFSVLMLLALLFGAGGVTPALADVFWLSAGSMATARSHHTATLLSNGKALVVGGEGNGGGALASAELYDPTNNTWISAGSMATVRSYHTATLLSNGKVLVVGGQTDSVNALASAELYDPTSNSWISAGSMATVRTWHTATLLSNDKVLIVGGNINNSGGGALASAELYDPISNSWTSAGSMATVRFFHTATLLSNGKALVVGGHDGSMMPYLASTELYDPISNSWSSASPLTVGRSNHTATLLSNGKALVVGGMSNGNAIIPSYPTSAELYDPDSNSWTSAGDMTSARASHTATLLSSGKALVAGGYVHPYALSILASAEEYDPASNSWTSAGAMTSARRYHTATLLSGGKVLVAGGSDYSYAAYPPKTSIADRHVLVAGGSYALASAELYDMPQHLIYGSATYGGNGVAGIDVALYRQSLLGTWYEVDATQTDSSGTYIFDVQNGDYRVGFSDPTNAYSDVFSGGATSLDLAETIIISNNSFARVDVTLSGSGGISGTVSLEGGGDAQQVAVTLYRGTSWAVASTNPALDGTYTFSGLPAGNNYHVYFNGAQGFRPEYWDNSPTMGTSQAIIVTQAAVRTNINAEMDLPAAPLAQITGKGIVYNDPETGQVTLTTMNGNVSAITISTQAVSCPTGSPTNVMLWLGTTSYPMTENPSGSGIYQANIPASSVVSAQLAVKWNCDTAPLENEKIIGNIILYDPSGFITDAVSNLPIQDATVTLYKVPNWLPDVAGETRSCRTVDTRTGGATGNWNSEPPAQADLGVFVNPDISNEIDPAINPQVTDANGYYGWDVVEGCWYVKVQAIGYETLYSPVVGVPPAVTDLDLELTPLISTITFDANGGTGTMSTQSSNIAAALNPNIFTAPVGYTFAGWDTVALGGGAHYADGASYPFSVDDILYAQWSINTYTLNYIAGANGSIVGTNPQSVAHGANGTLVTATPAAGYHFVSWSDGVLTAARTDLNVTANKSVSANFTVYDTATFNPSWAGSVSITSDKNVVAIGRPHIGDEIASYSGFSAGASTAYVPMLFKNAFGGDYDSALYVQNVNPLVDANVSIKYYNSDTGALTCTDTDTITPLASKGYWLPTLSATECLPSGLPAGWVGSAVITSTTAHIVANARPHIDGEVMTYDSFSSGSLTSYLPMLFKNAYGTPVNPVGSYNSAFYVQNVDPLINAEVTIKYYDSATGTLTCTATDTIDPLSSKGYWLPTLPATECLPSGLPDGWVGGAVVTSTTAKIVSVGRSHLGSQINTYNGFASGGLSSYVPMLFRKAYGGTYDSALYVQNVDPLINAEVTIKFYDSYTGALTCTDTDTIRPLSSKGYWLPTLDAAECAGGGLPDDWVGSAVVTSTSANIVAIGRAHIGDQVTTYNGFSSGSLNSYLPMLFKNIWGYDSAFYIQNTETAEAAVTVKFYDTDGNLSCVRRDSIPALSTLGYWVPSVTCAP